MEERAALRWIAGAVGARSRVVYLPIDREEQRRCVTRRFATTPDRTFPMSDVELVQWQAGSTCRTTRRGRSGPRSAGHPCLTSTRRAPPS